MTGFVIKIRGGGLTLKEYRCPNHGVFEALVTRDAGDDRPCPIMMPVPSPPPPGLPPGYRDMVCATSSPRCFTSAPAVHTQFVVSATQGKHEKPPHPLAVNTEALAQGQGYHAWRKGRAKLREEERHRRVKELLK